MSPIDQILEWVAAISGILCVYLLTRENIWAWIFGLISVGIYVYIFWINKLYSDTILHVVYVVLNAYGLYAWTRRTKVPNTANTDLLTITWLPNIQRWGYLILIVIGSLLWGYGMNRYTDASYPYPDAFTTVASLVAQYLIARKRLENWLIWIVVDVVAIVIYGFKGIWVTSGLYVVYLVLSVLGFREWRNRMAEP
ncbi:MAG TPA: nicotinamide riboside transporter PnuC [Saprospiraceae bacterium]|nr:nicotinamide mononucleotide transporter [Saprospiraceae bacterium]MCB9269344.1 nicotinamide mononucleotide transporter [Lewinellaceae bacterium]HPG08893.1 nicotinamide riboside transporter PnuC [Saprospiraceae bacterium]HRV85484.1 nicotinamide riboside transporter PnuC [Saprospiraceae bacterium]